MEDIITFIAMMIFLSIIAYIVQFFDNCKRRKEENKRRRIEDKRLREERYIREEKLKLKKIEESFANTGFSFIQASGKTLAFQSYADASYIARSLKKSANTSNHYLVIKWRSCFFILSFAGLKNLPITHKKILDQYFKTFLNEIDGDKVDIVEETNSAISERKTELENFSKIRSTLLAKVVKFLTNFTSPSVPGATAVYIISSSTAIKIGITSNADKRLSQIQTGNPDKLSYKKLYWFKTKEIAEVVEKESHKKLANKRTKSNGEWFDISEKDAIHTVDSVIENLSNNNLLYSRIGDFFEELKNIQLSSEEKMLAEVVPKYFSSSIDASCASYKNLYKNFSNLEKHYYGVSQTKNRRYQIMINNNRLPYTFETREEANIALFQFSTSNIILSDIVEDGWYFYDI